MSFIVNHNTGTDTAVPGVSTLTLTRGIPNFGADWREKMDSPEESIITNLNAPVAYPEKFRTAVSEISDIYKNTGIANTLMAPTRKGRNILSQLTEVWTVTDSVDTTYLVALPVSCHIVLKVPDHPAITASDIITLIGRAVSGLYETGDATGSRLQALMRGALKPTDM